MVDHINIAKVFDGGATDEGRPYFVMELVRGVPITTYAATCIPSVLLYELLTGSTPLEADMLKKAGFVGMH